jgi:hypothetical protein
MFILFGGWNVSVGIESRLRCWTTGQPQVGTRQTILSFPQYPDQFCARPPPPASCLMGAGSSFPDAEAFMCCRWPSSRLGVTYSRNKTSVITLILVIGIILERTETDHCQVARKNSKILISLALINGYLDNSVLKCVVFSDCRKYAFYC